MYYGLDPIEKRNTIACDRALIPGPALADPLDGSKNGIPLGPNMVRFGSLTHKAVSPGPKPYS